MKGKLIKRGNDWYIMRFEENEWETYYPIDPEQLNLLNDNDENKEVNFYKSQDILNKYVTIQFSFPELERKLVLNNDSWDSIFDYIKNNLNEDIPIRVINYFKNTFLIPIRKNDN